MFEMTGGEVARAMTIGIPKVVDHERILRPLPPIYRVLYWMHKDEQLPIF